MHDTARGLVTSSILLEYTAEPMMRSIAAAAWSAALGAISIQATTAKPVPTAIVATHEGPVRGYMKGGVDVFLGIPFAAPPVGDLRWRPPAPPARWVKPLDAVTFGGRCVQTNTFGVFAAPSENENCLYLNVFAPGRASAPSDPERPSRQGLRPVMVWIHGGGFFDGESNDYDGTGLAVAGDVIVVTINYRVNVFGFLAHPALDAEGHAAVNYGLMDQQAALGWVQRNIRAFGGNPDNVTIFGESAGGTSVLFQLASPAAAGLFHRAIVHSPAYAPAQATLPDAEAKGRQFGAALGCADQSAACLRSRSVRDIIARASAFVGGGPVRAVDGTIVAQNMGDAFRSGHFNRVPVMIGNNLDEQTWFIGMNEIAAGEPLSVAAYSERIQASYAANASKVLAQYPLSDYANPSEALAAATTASGFACGTRRAIRLLAPQVRTWAYEFRDRTAPFYFPHASFTYGAGHTLELQYLFPGFHGATGAPQALTTAERRLSKVMLGYWTSFARSGDPDSHGTPRWAPYQVQQDNYQSLEPPDPKETHDFSSVHRCAFWDGL
jgi:para-nitrobenzyl esterase